MKILGLDIGDVWTGIAISDALGILAKPYQTVKTNELTFFLKKLLAQEKIAEIVVGYPKTMKGTESEQTVKAVSYKEKLAQEFPDKSFILWDERLSSKRAETLKHAKTKEEKIHAHSVAAAFILQTYLTYKTPIPSE